MEEEIKKEIYEKIDEIGILCEELFYLIPVDEEGGKEVRKYVDTIADNIRDTIYQKMGVNVRDE